MPNKILKGLTPSMYDTPYNSKTSAEYYKNHLQEKINETYEYAPNTEPIMREIESGTLNFESIDCRVCHAIEPKTGLNLGDDFKDVKFFDLNADVRMGQRYSFCNSVWITVNTDNYRYITKSAILRKCNNVLKFIDDNGDIVEEPCIIDYAMKYSNLYFNKAVNINQGTIVLIAQYNSNTKNITNNDRFIFGSQVFKVKSINDFLRGSTYDVESTPLITYELFIDTRADDDDFELGIADMNKYKNIYNPNIITDGIIVSPNKVELLETEKQEYTCDMYINGERQNKQFSFVASNVPKEYYNLDIIDGNTFSVTNNKWYKLNPLRITCKCDTDEYSFDIWLRGLF